MNTSHLSTPLTDGITHLRTLFAPLETLPGVGDKRIKLFKRLLGDRAMDALFHLPSGILTFTPITDISQAKQGQNVIIKARIVSHAPSPRRGSPHKITCHDGLGFFEILYFHGQSGYIQNILPSQSYRIIVGKAERKNERWQICHPEMVLPPEAEGRLPQRDVVYPLTTGITSRCVARVIDGALVRITTTPEWIYPETRTENQWMTWSMAIRQIHDPRTPADLSPALNKARERLAYDELFAHQLALQIVRRHAVASQPGKAMAGTGGLIQKLLAKLPYEPTNAQKRCLQEIFEDMTKPHVMTRLIQGDVGSGKTLVAMIAMLKAVESGYQAAILAPTDILARQHGENMIALYAEIGVTADILTARETGKKRQKLLEDLAQGTIQILIGTHAIIEQTVQFQNLGLAVIDEQHRFGVEQRLKLTQKGNNPDILAMTATPIPRTLQLANYGDMEVSIIDEKPAGRQPIQTKVLPLDRLEDVVTRAARALESKAKIFWVCPLVEESEVLDVAAAEQRYFHLRSLFGERVGLVHGKMKAKDKDEVMDGFIQGGIDILVATTVIEVGVNVPAATIMIIEHAERFGLAQLHQLRGRIGRGSNTATCLLLYGNQLSQVGRQRLETMRETEDGFKIAEADLRLRGGGDILGTRQSGLPGFRLADFTEHPDRCKELLSMANRDAKKLCKEDPFLTGEIGTAARLLLKIFGKDDAIKYTRS